MLCARYQRMGRSKTVQLRLRAWQPDQGQALERDYVYNWVVERFPWDFTPEELLSSALVTVGQQPPGELENHVQVDLRGGPGIKVSCCASGAAAAHEH